MTLRIQLIVGLVLLVSLVVIVNMIHKKRLELKYALSWISVIVALLILDVFPDIMRFISTVMGIETPINMLIFCGFCFSMVIIFTLTVALSRTAKRLKKLAQNLALLEMKLHED
ncbi:DUF2304 domain-containing protein [Parasporobacterium paucivorans]|uniref:DUF2304 domain-containing protein n=1 Tax=Parasporobacterium paucivorans DSM 15970 TaxID=1122934 RepID=A0A1M6JUG2_9FIRM|nr:DUF2304 domain-containing protein [Parasporobacterium paucivorans]SHJ50299.1 hypothetical protein SAMN02745691_02071 [Parasporobacterium paucivorans DSM 15970]